MCEVITVYRKSALPVARVFREVWYNAVRLVSYIIPIQFVAEERSEDKAMTKNVGYIHEGSMFHPIVSSLP